MKTLKPRLTILNTTTVKPKTVTRDRSRAQQRRREAYLRAHPMCQRCNDRVATILDHIVAIINGGSDADPSNWQGLCTPCHTIKTRDDMAIARGAA